MDIKVAIIVFLALASCPASGIVVPPTLSYDHAISSGSTNCASSSPTTSNCCFVVQDTVTENWWTAYSTEARYYVVNVTSITVSITPCVDTTITNFETNVYTANISSSLVIEVGNNPLKLSSDMAPQPAEVTNGLNSLIGSQIITAGVTIQSPVAFLVFSTVKVIAAAAVTDSHGQVVCVTSSALSYNVPSDEQYTISGVNSNAEAYFDRYSNVSQGVVVSFPTPYIYVPKRGLAGETQDSDSEPPIPGLNEDFGYVPQAVINYMASDPAISSQYPGITSCLPGGPSIILPCGTTIVEPTSQITMPDLTSFTTTTVYSSGFPSGPKPTAHSTISNCTSPMTPTGPSSTSSNCTGPTTPAGPSTKSTTPTPEATTQVIASPFTNPTTPPTPSHSVAPTNQTIASPLTNPTTPPAPSTTSTITTHLSTTLEATTHNNASPFTNPTTTPTPSHSAAPAVKTIASPLTNPTIPPVLSTTPTISTRIPSVAPTVKTIASPFTNPTTPPAPSTASTTPSPPHPSESQTHVPPFTTPTIPPTLESAISGEPTTSTNTSATAPCFTTVPFDSTVLHPGRTTVISGSSFVIITCPTALVSPSSSAPTATSKIHTLQIITTQAVVFTTMTVLQSGTGSATSSSGFVEPIGGAAVGLGYPQWWWGLGTAVLFMLTG